MTNSRRWLGALSAAALALTLLAGLALSFPARAQDDFAPIPTPTLYPAENTPYTLETVGGEDMTRTFQYADQEGFTLGETTVTSRYPRGMIFTINPQSENGAITDVTLSWRYVHESGDHRQAEYDAERDLWTVHIWESGAGRPAWTHMRFHWRVRDESGTYVDTEEYEVDYWDPAREWFRMESEDVILYWFGFGEDDPDTIAQNTADRMASATPRQIAGFGRRLSYKPIAVVYPDKATFGEIQGSGIANPRVAGYTSSDLGISVQVLREVPTGPSSCIWAAPPDYWTMEHRIATIYATTPHEVTHLYQYDVIGYAPGVEWVSEGQAEFFANNFRNGEERLRHLATLQDIPSLLTPIGSDLPQADGCSALSYVVGASFWNFLNIRYGGMETIHQIIEYQKQQKSIYEAVEAITGKPFLEVENEWRTHYGFRPLTLADIDPAAALEPYDDPMVAEGDTVTLPATPPLSPLAEKPGAKSLASGQCFAGTQVTVLRIGALDGVPYYEVDCMGMVGWMTRDQLFGPGN